VRLPGIDESNDVPFGGSYNEVNVVGHEAGGEEVYALSCSLLEDGLPDLLAKSGSEGRDLGMRTDREVKPEREVRIELARASDVLWERVGHCGIIEADVGAWHGSSSPGHGGP
jgi:hypothetical protein